MQAQRDGHILRMSTFPDLIHCPDPQRLKGLMIEFPAIVIPHDPILPDHKIKVELLMNYLVSVTAAARVSLHRMGFFPNTGQRITVCALACHQGISPGYVPGHSQYATFGRMTNVSLTAPDYSPGPAESPPALADAASTSPADRWTTIIDGHKVRQLRRQLGLSQYKLADQAQVGMTTIARLERQRRAPCRTYTLARIAAALGEPLDAIRPVPADDESTGSSRGI